MDSNKDLKVKVGTPTEALWNKVKIESEMMIKQSENTIIIHKEILKLAKDKILLEKRK